MIVFGCRGELLEHHPKKISRMRLRLACVEICQLEHTQKHSYTTLNALPLLHCSKLDEPFGTYTEPTLGHLTSHEYKESNASEILDRR